VGVQPDVSFLGRVVVVVVRVLIALRLSAARQTVGERPSMILPPEAWMDLRKYRPLREAGATWKAIADEPGLDPRTVK